jgi:antitoxin (DNA-binding transcriptional repressor) of toxin-antitoxin stability system
LRELSRRANTNKPGSLPVSTLSDALRRNELPPWRLVESFVTACGVAPGRIERWRVSWQHQPVSVSADELHSVGRQAAVWEEAVRRAEHGETVAVIAHGEHVADVVPSGELARLRETIEVLSDTDAVRALADTEPVVHGRYAIRALVAERAARERG